MKKSNFIWIIALLAAAALFGALWQSQGTAQASNGPTEAGWLAFDGLASPGTPAASVLTTNAQAIDVQASLPGAWVETVVRRGPRLHAPDQRRLRLPHPGRPAGTARAAA